MTAAAMTPVVVLTTVGAGFDARSLARELVEQRVVACVNILPAVQSIYRWEGKVAEDGEQLLVMKTARERIDALRAVLLPRHPYDVPELVVLDIARIEASYRDWLLASL